MSAEERELISSLAAEANKEIKTEGYSERAKEIVSAMLAIKQQ